LRRRLARIEERLKPRAPVVLKRAVLTSDERRTRVDALIALAQHRAATGCPALSPTTERSEAMRLRVNELLARALAPRARGKDAVVAEDEGTVGRGDTR
jgi:hypothetical protein